MVKDSWHLCCFGAIAAVAAGAQAQPAPFLQGLGVPPGAATSYGVRVSPSGEWVFGSSTDYIGVQTSVFLWRRSPATRFDVSLPPGVGLTPVIVNETVPLVAANGFPSDMFLFDGVTFQNIGSTLPPYSSVSLAGATADLRLICFNGMGPGGPTGIALFGGALVDLGSVVQAAFPFPIVSVTIADVATGRASSIGLAREVTGREVPFLLDHCSNIVTPLFSPTGEAIYPQAISDDGLAVTGIAVSAIAAEAFCWTRRGSPVGGPYTGTFTLLGFLDPTAPVSIPFGVDAAGDAVVGYSANASNGVDAFVWFAPKPPNPGGIRNLFTELTVVNGLPAGPFVSLNEGADISPRGVISGSGVTSATYAEAFAARLPRLGCRADFTAPYGVIDVGDALQFATLFANGAIEADFDYDCQLTPADGTAFVAEWALGCQ